MKSIMSKIMPKPKAMPAKGKSVPMPKLKKQSKLISVHIKGGKTMGTGKNY